MSSYFCSVFVVYVQEWAAFSQLEVTLIGFSAGSDLCPQTALEAEAGPEEVDIFTGDLSYVLPSGNSFF